MSGDAVVLVEGEGHGRAPAWVRGKDSGALACAPAGTGWAWGAGGLAGPNLNGSKLDAECGQAQHSPCDGDHAESPNPG